MLLLACVAVVSVALGLVLRHSLDGADDYRTAIGESQSVLLSDGTRLSLNTDTRVRVAFSAGQRLVNVTAGEAVFDVAKDASRPFVVRAAGSEVVALGTVFSVRLLPQGQGESLAVVLVEGRVEVRPAASEGGVDGVAPERRLEMKAGERVRLMRAAGSTSVPALQLDRPRLDRTGLAAQRGRVRQDHADRGRGRDEPIQPNACRPDG
jgi:transmembrane sensor